MKITAILLVIALIVPLTGCGYLTLDDPKVAKLEKELAEMAEEKELLRVQRDELIGKVNDLTADNWTLKAEKEELGKALASAVEIAEWYQRVVHTTVPEKVESIYVIDFDHNQLYNKPTSRLVAKDVVEAINKHGSENVKIKIEAYSSKAGSEAINKWFAKERAEGVMHKIYEAYNSGQLDIEIIAHGETKDDQRKVVVTVEVP